MEVSVVFPFDKDTPDVRGKASIRPYSTFNSSTGRMREIWAVVAMGRGNEIGFGGDMPWHLPEDLRRFKELTMGHPVVMGRSTWLSIPKRPLPGRRNIVLSRSAAFRPEGAETAPSLEAALALAPPPEIPIVIGGGTVYAQALPLVSRLFVTRIDRVFPQADTFFPAIDRDAWMLSDVSEPMLSKTGLPYRFETYENRRHK